MERVEVEVLDQAMEREARYRSSVGSSGGMYSGALILAQGLKIELNGPAEIVAHCDFKMF